MRKKSPKSFAKNLPKKINDSSLICILNKKVAMIDECTITDCKANILKINHRHNHGPDAALVGKIIKNCKVLLLHF